MNVSTLFTLQVLIYAAFPFYLAMLQKRHRAAGFYILISIYLVIGGFLGSVYAFPLTETIKISGGNLAYGALMMTSILFVLIEKDIGVLRNIIRLVFGVNLFKVLLFSTISWALQNQAVLNPRNTDFAVFNTSVFFVILGGALIILELFLFVLIFEQLKKWISNVIVLAILYSLTFVLVLCLDGVLFPTIAFAFNPEIVAVVIGGVKGRLFMAAAYSTPLLLFLVVFRRQLTEFIYYPLAVTEVWEAPTEELIEEIQRQQQELFTSEARYRNLVEDLPILLCTFLPGGEISFVNKIYGDYFDRSVDDLVGSSFLDLIPETDRETVMANFSSLTPEYPSLTQEHQVIAPGHEIRWQRWNNRALFNDKGKVIAYQSIGEDITERVHREKELNLFRTIFDASQEAIAISDAEGQFVYINPAHEKLFGRTLEQARQVNYRDYYPPESVELLNDQVVPALQRGESWEGVLDVFDVEGRRFPLWERADSIRDEQGNLLYAFGLMHDVSEQTKTEEELRKHRNALEGLIAERTNELSAQILESEQLNDALGNLLEDFQAANESLENATRQLYDANQELKAFTYSVSHDLRAPLRAVDGFSQILLEEYVDQMPEAAARYLDKISQGAQHMGQLITDLLALSRLGRKELQKRQIEPVTIVEQALMELGNELIGREIEIQVGDLPSFFVDSSLMKQVYLNLIGNAIKFTSQRKDAAIQIGWGDFGDQKVYYVKDNGVGFDMEYADKLFGVFQRLHPVEQFEGTGVGLAIVKRIIRRHGGQVLAEAKPDKGATFYFTMPEEDKI